MTRRASRIWIVLVGLAVEGCAALDGLLAPSPPPPKPPSVREAPAPRILTPAVTRGEAGELQRAVQEKIQDAERLAVQLDARPLTQDQRDTLSTVWSFIDRARERLAHQDFSAASTLAEKALILAGDLNRQR